MSFISVSVKTAIIVHGYDHHNREIIETVADDAFMKKIVAVSRILSLSEKYILVTGSHGRIMYWEYQESMEEIAEKLGAAGLLI